MRFYKLQLIIFLLLSGLHAEAQGVFTLYSKKEHADINYLTIKNINFLEHGYNAMIRQFEPVKGEYSVYMFIKEFIGTSKYKGQIQMHDLIILKTSNDSTVLDGFFYRLEWAEVPSQFGIFRTSNYFPVKLKNNLPVSLLEFVNEYEFFCDSSKVQPILASFENDLIRF